MAIEDNLNQILREEAFDKQGVMDLIRSGAIPGGTNLVQSNPFEYGSYQIPASDPTFTSGLNYARTIAGGMPFEDVVAPGLQFSPEAPMGLTQEQLNLIAQGPAPVMPVAPTIGEPVAPSEPMMPFAPVGTPEPSLPSIPPMQFDLRDIGRPTLFDFDVEGLLKDVEPKALEDVLEQIEAPSLFDDALTMPSAPTTMMGAMPQIPQFLDAGKSVATPFMPGYQGEAQTSQTPQTVNIFGTDVTLGQYGKAPTTKKDSLFGGLSSAVTRPDLPVPEFGFINRPTFAQAPVVREPAINVEDIVSPIRTGSTRVRTPNLFNIV